MTVLYPRLGTKVDKNFINSLEKETIIYNSGKRWVTFTGKSIKTTGLYAWRHKRLSRGFLIFTSKRIVAIAGGYKLIDVQKDHPLHKTALTFDRTNPKRYAVSADLSKFPNKITGSFTLSYWMDPNQVQGQL